ncbi:MAG: GerMN domain-containing protein [Armatimonadota bacterium]
MKLTRFRFHRTHWFSGAILVLLMVGLYRPTVTGNRTTARQSYRQVRVYHVVSNRDDQWLEPVTRNLDRREEPMAGAINLMTRFRESESPLPPGTRALSVTVNREGVAWADFTNALVENFEGGSLRESLAINAVLGTLAQFPGVRAVQFTVEGNKIESIGGHEDISEPQSLTPEKERPATPTASATPLPGHP